MTGAGLVCAAALVFDAFLLGRLPGLARLPGPLAALALAHAGACLVFSLALVKLLPERLRTPALGAGLFAFLSSVFMPVLGMAGLLGLLPAWRRQGQAVRASGWQHSDIPGLPDGPQRPQAGRGLFKGGGLAGALQHAADPARRMAALIATLSLPTRQAVPLLRLALKDPDDEVRLLAYALLNRKEKAIEARMRQQQSAPADDAPAQAFARHKALAHDYWELAHLGDPQGDALLSLCGRAQEHALAALGLRPDDGGLHVLCGRIWLVQRQFDAAGAAFVRARACGIDARQIAALLAEVAFRRQGYGDVRQHLAQLGNCAHPVALSRPARYWGARA